MTALFNRHVHFLAINFSFPSLRGKQWKFLRTCSPFYQNISRFHLMSPFLYFSQLLFRWPVRQYAGREANVIEDTPPPLLRIKRGGGIVSSFQAWMPLYCIWKDCCRKSSYTTSLKWSCIIPNLHNYNTRKRPEKVSFQGCFHQSNHSKKIFIPSSHSQIPKEFYL